MMTIEQMIDKGCTLEDAMDALQELFAQKVEKNTRVESMKKAREDVVTAYTNFLKICDPEIPEKDLKKQVAQLEATLKLIGDIFLKADKIFDVQLKSKEEMKKDAANGGGASLEDFLKAMKW